MEKEAKKVLDGRLSQFDLGDQLSDLASWLSYHHRLKLVKALIMCGRQLVGWSCREGHHFLRRISCQRQICPKCSENDSPAHKRRYSRAWPRMMWPGRVGYVVLTVPVEYRHLLNTKAKLREMSKASWNVVSLVFDPYFDLAKGGLVSLHFYGDQSDVYNPHVNVLFPTSGRVSRAKLKELRREWRLALERILGVEIPESKENARYEYSSDSSYYEDALKKAEKTGEKLPDRDSVNEGMKIHWLQYILRSTVGFERFCRLGDRDRLFILQLIEKDSDGIFHNVRWCGELANCKYRKILLSLREKGKIEIPKAPSDGCAKTYICVKCGAESTEHYCFECGAWCQEKAICPVCSAFVGSTFRVVGDQDVSPVRLDGKKDVWLVEAERKETGEIWLSDKDGKPWTFVEVRKNSGFFCDRATWRQMESLGLVEGVGEVDGGG